MGVYYYLVNHTKKQVISVNSYVKSQQITGHHGVTMAMIRYMIEHPDDTFSIQDDYSYHIFKEGWVRVDLSCYEFDLPPTDLMLAAFVGKEDDAQN